MLINDETVCLLKQVFDAMDHALAENLIYQKMLDQAGMTNWRELLRKQIEIQENRTELDERLADFRATRHKIFRYLETGGIDDELRSESSKPN